MLVFLYRRLINNKWLFLCLLLGGISTTAIIAAIPMYANGILQKVLIKDLEIAQQETQSPSGRWEFKYKGDGYFDPDLINHVNQIDAQVTDQFENDFALPVLEKVSQLKLDRLTVQRENDSFYNDQNFMIYPTTIDHYEEHVQWIYGEAPKSERVDGVYQVAISDEALKSLQLMQDTVYDLVKKDVLKNELEVITQFKIVGIFKLSNPNDLFWADGRYASFVSNLVFNRASLNQLFDGVKPLKLNESENILYFDYHKIYIGNIPRLLSAFSSQLKWIKAEEKPYSIEFPIMKMLKNYEVRQKQLRITLWILVIPLMIIMAFYAVIVSNLIVSNDKNEIAMLKSRGAKRYQIFLLYLWECIIIAIISMGVGPLLSIGICKVLGASNGFLEFVSRKAMAVKLSGEVYLYATLAIIAFCFFVLMPVVAASRIHIVQYKRSLLNKNKKPLWQKLFLDFIILGISIYGLEMFKTRQNILGLSGLDAAEVKIDPLLFFISTLFILGMSLVFLRLYPMLVKIIFKIGEKKWHPVMYFSLVNVSRSDKNLQAIMLFLILSISFGLINANQARTINVNAVDRIAYGYGADVVIEPYNSQLHQGSLPAGADASSIPFEEPPYNKYEALDGIETITKVYQEKEVKLTGPAQPVIGMKIMGITPNEFGKIAWFRNDLLPHHINEYLNMMSSAPKAILLSSNMQKEFNIRLGDTVFADIQGLGTLECTVYGFIDYFPSYNPFNLEGENSYLGVMNANYIADKLPLHPYEIWIKKAEGTTDATIQNQLVDNKLRVESIKFAQQAIIKQKNDPMLLGTNGILTMCFMIEMIIAAIGFIIFWMLSIKERSLKFGIFRAIGMPMSQVGWIMICEQLLVSGMAICLGFFLGTLSSQLFIPLLELVYSSSAQVPKFRVIADMQDYFKLLMMTLSMLLVCLMILYRQINQIKMNQVIKLGEDS